MVSVICEAFECTPSEALRQDWRLVRDVLDYRLLEAAKRQHNDDATKMSPGMAAIWQEAIEAANGC